MERIDKKLGQDLKRENEYAGEEIRIAEILKTRISEEEVAKIVFELEKIAKEDDRVVAKILAHPRVIERYDLDAYDGLTLQPKAPAQLPMHFIRDGLWKIKHLDEDNLFASGFLNQDGTYIVDVLLSWFREDLDFNKLRLEQLEKTSELMITDPTKVRIRKVELEEEKTKKSNKKETIH